MWCLGWKRKSLDRRANILSYSWFCTACFLFLGKMPSGIKTNIKSASMHPYQRWANANQTQGTAVTNIVPAAATTHGFLFGLPSSFTHPYTISTELGVMTPFPGFYLVLGGLCGAARSHVSWRQVLCSARAAFFCSNNLIFFRSGLKCTYPFLIQNVKSVDHSASCFCLLIRDAPNCTPCCWIKTLFCTL